MDSWVSVHSLHNVDTTAGAQRCETPLSFYLLCTCRRSLTSCGDCSFTPISRAIAAKGSVVGASAAGVGMAAHDAVARRSLSLPSRVRVTHPAGRTGLG